MAAHGSLAEVELHDGTALRDFSDYVTETGLNRLRDMADVTTIGGKTDKSYIPGLKDSTIPLDGVYDATVDGWLDTIFGLSTEQVVNYYPMGNAATRPKYTGNYFMPKYDLKTGTGDAIRMTAEAQVTGGLTRSVV